jgi:hypothetical protein
MCGGCRTKLRWLGIARRLRRRSVGLSLGVAARRYLWAQIVDELIVPVGYLHSTPPMLY